MRSIRKGPNAAQWILGVVAFALLGVVAALPAVVGRIEKLKESKALIMRTPPAVMALFMKSGDVKTMPKLEPFFRKAGKSGVPDNPCNAGNVVDSDVTEVAPGPMVRMNGQGDRLGRAYPTYYALKMWIDTTKPMIVGDSGGIPDPGRNRLTVQV